MPPKNRNKQLLDLLFMIDTTGSMGPYIRKAEEKINEITKAITEKGHFADPADFRVGILAYRDFVDPVVEYVTDPFPFTSDIAKVKDKLRHLGASGGGDGPEAVATAMSAAINMQWLPTADNYHKIIVQVTDAPPHGVVFDDEVDGNQEGDPAPAIEIYGVDDELRNNNIFWFVVMCQPEMGTYEGAEAFYSAKTRTAGIGDVINLTDAKYLPEAIVGFALQAHDLGLILSELDDKIGRPHPESDSTDSDASKISMLAASSFSPFTSFAMMPAAASKLESLLSAVADAGTPGTASAKDMHAIYASAKNAAEARKALQAKKGGSPDAALKELHDHLASEGVKIRQAKSSVPLNISPEFEHNLGVFSSAKKPGDAKGKIKSAPSIAPTGKTEKVDVVEAPMTMDQVKMLAATYKNKKKKNRGRV